MSRLVMLLLAAVAAIGQTIVAYGDVRFTDPKETLATNPKVRKWLIEKIAAEKPKALLFGGDIPYQGANANDYAVFHSETAQWRAAHIPLYPALGNHEFYGAERNGDYEKQGLENWWNEFPHLRGKRWYSASLTKQIFVLTLDSASPLLPGSPQAKWIADQLAVLKPSVKYVFISLHHPPVSNVETGALASHNVRPNEVALAEYLKNAPIAKRVRFVVVAGHIHNYERFERDGITYMVSGGGGAAPVPVTRGAEDLYQDKSYPNYHYVKFVVKENHLEGEMIRVADPLASAPQWEVKDRFQISQIARK